MKTFDYTSDGSIYFDERLQKYRIQFSYVDSDGIRRRKSFTGKNKREVLYKRNDFRENHDFYEKKSNNKYITLSKILLEDAKYDNQINLTGESAYYRRLQTIKIIQNSNIGNIPISNITERTISSFLSSCTHYSNSSIRKIYSELNKGFEIAMDDDIIVRNPMKKRAVKKPYSKKTDKKIVALTVEQQNLFINYLNNEPMPTHGCDYRYQFFIEMFAGLRMGEINALQYNDIDLQNNVIHVSKTITRGVNERVLIGEKPKTYAGYRDVLISDELRPYLVQLLMNYRNNKENLLFYDYDNSKPISTARVNCSFKRICKKIGIYKEGFAQHMLRHTFATRCIEAGVSAEVLMTWLGHSSIDITIDTYTDVQVGYKKDNLNKLNSYLSKAISFTDEKCTPNAHFSYTPFEKP